MPDPIVPPVTPPVTPETPPVTPEAPPTPPTPSKETDISALKEEIATDVSGKISKEVSQSVLSKIGEALGLSKKEEAKLPTNPEELKTMVESIAEQKAQAIIKSRDDEASQREQAKQTQLEEGAKNYQKTWTRDYTEMANLKMVPPIVKPDDKEDLGNKVKNQMLLKLKSILDENEKNGIDYVPSLWEIANRFPDVTRLHTVAGADAPISGGGRNMGPGTTEYDRIHNTPFDEMIAGK